MLWAISLWQKGSVHEKEIKKAARNRRVFFLWLLGSLYIFILNLICFSFQPHFLITPPTSDTKASWDVLYASCIYYRSPAQRLIGVILNSMPTWRNKKVRERRLHVVVPIHKQDFEKKILFLQSERKYSYHQTVHTGFFYWKESRTNFHNKICHPLI